MTSLGTRLAVDTSGWQSESISYPKGKSNFAPHCVQPYVLYSHTTVPPGCAIIYTERTVFLTAVSVDHIRAEQ